MVNKLLSEKIDRIDEKNIEKIIDSKLEKIEAILEKQVAEKKSYASVTNSQPSDFKSIMKMAKIEEISEERDRRSRASNIIVHGVKEDREEAENIIWRVRGSPKNGTLRLKKFSMASNSQL